MIQLMKLKKEMETHPKISKPSKAFNSRHMSEFQPLMDEIFKEYKKFFSNPNMASVIYWDF